MGPCWHTGRLQQRRAAGGGVLTNCRAGETSGVKTARPRQIWKQENWFCSGVHHCRCSSPRAGTPASPLCAPKTRRGQDGKREPKRGNWEMTRVFEQGLGQSRALGCCFWAGSRGTCRSGAVCTFLEGEGGARGSGRRAGA